MTAGLDKIAAFAAETVLPTILIIAAAVVIERRHPIEPNQSKSEIILDYKLGLANIFLAWVFAPIGGMVMAMGVNMAGGGLITLRADGWWFPLSLAVTVLAVEFQGYWFHRLQHCVPVLWSMHSLHHSAEAMTVATGVRHYWAEQAIILAFLPSVAMVFKIPPEVMRFVPCFFAAEYLAHMNINVRSGPMVLVFNTPQFHRIHHSAEPRHWNKNFSKNLPILDLIFGTAWIPARDEFPRTGLSAQEKPANLFEGLVWPLRHLSFVQRMLKSVRDVLPTVRIPFASKTS